MENTIEIQSPAKNKTQTMPEFLNDLNQVMKRCTKIREGVSLGSGAVLFHRTQTRTGFQHMNTEHRFEKNGGAFRRQNPFNPPRIISGK